MQTLLAIAAVMLLAFTVAVLFEPPQIDRGIVRQCVEDPYQARIVVEGQTHGGKIVSVEIPTDPWFDGYRVGDQWYRTY